MMKKLTWKRLVPENANRGVPQAIIHCPSLETLEIATLLKKNDETSPMPMIHAQDLHRMELCAVHGSDIPWDFPFHFTEETLASVKEVSMTANHSKASGALQLKMKDLSPIASSLISLSITGYIPLFIIANDGDLDASFPSLKSLHLDISYLALDIPLGKPRPLANVLLEREKFPVLERLKLDISQRDRSQLLYDGMCDLNIHVPASCKVLTVLEPLSSNHLVVVIEDEQRCRVKALDSGRYHGESADGLMTGFLSAHLM